MTTAKKLMSASELLALPDDGKRYELIRGVLITMAPASDPHGGVTDRIGRRIGNFVEAPQSWPQPRAAETGVFTEHDPDTVRAPDYAFISHERMSGAPPTSGYSEIIPDLVVEVIAGDYRSSAGRRQNADVAGRGCKAGPGSVHRHAGSGGSPR